MTWEHGFILCALLLFICVFGLASACIEWALERCGQGMSWEDDPERRDEVFPR